MGGLERIEWEECFIEPRRNAGLERECRQALGQTLPIARYFTACPWVVRSFISFWPDCIGLVYASFELAELIALVVSQDNSCRYCYATTRVGLRLLGIPESRVQRLEQDLYGAVADPKTWAVLEFARRTSRANPLPTAADAGALRDAGYDELAIKEIAFLVAVNVYFNRAMTLPAIPIDAIEQLPGKTYFRLLRPLLSRIARSHQRRGQLLPPVEIAGDAPYAYLVRSLDGLPAATALRSVLENAWESPILPRRSKAIVFAVIARGLGCPASEKEAHGILREEGFSEDEIEDSLSRLAGPKLSEFEAAAVPFARETIWYQPAQIQRRARALRGRMSDGEFVELVGLTALANAACRLSAAVCEGGRD